MPEPTEREATAALTAEEVHVLNLTADLWNAFIRLDNQHPASIQEIAFHLHGIQNAVMARLAVRAHPELFWEANWKRHGVATLKPKPTT